MRYVLALSVVAMGGGLLAVSFNPTVGALRWLVLFIGAVQLLIGTWLLWRSRDVA